MDHLRVGQAPQEIADAASKPELFSTILSACQTQYYLPDPSAITPTSAKLYESVGLTPSEIAAIAGAVPKRDIFYKSPLGRNDAALAVAGFVLLVATAWAMTRIFSGRGAMLQMGALMATMMAANVFLLISQSVDGEYYVYQFTGDPQRTRNTARRTHDWVREVQERGAGEIVLNCMSSDGVRQGYDIAQLASVRRICKVPLVASGGAGRPEHFAEVFSEARVDGALAASVFHTGALQIPALKQFLRTQAIEVRP